MNRVIVSCPAKVNLFLNIIGKKDNMHLLKMINQSVDLFDYLTIRINQSNQINISCNQSNVPIDERNSVFKAAEAMRMFFNIPFGFDIDITKNIPTGSGLGGESTDAAGTILGIKELLNLDISDEYLNQIGFSIGADVPFCLKGGFCFVEGFGEIITKQKSNIKPLLIIHPRFSKSTKKIYKLYDEMNKEFTIKPIIYGYNDFEKIAPPEIQKIKNGLRYYGAHITNMTGSGPAVIGVFDNNQERIQAYEDLKNYFNGYDKYLANPCKGIKVLKK